MSQTLLKFIGIDPRLTEHIEQVQWLWARPTLLWIGLLLLVPLGVGIVLRHRSSLPQVGPLGNALLSTCRIGILGLLVVVIAAPYLRLSQAVTRKPILALLVDESASMDLPAGPFQTKRAPKIARAAGLIESAYDPQANADGESQDDEGSVQLDAETRKKLSNLSRSDLLKRLLKQQEETAMAPLGERFEVRTYRFAREAERGELSVAEEASSNDSENEANKSDTALGGAMATAIRDAGGREIAGILVFSDGRSTTGPNPRWVARQQTLTRAGSRRRVPIWTVPIGGREPLADLGIVDVLGPSQVAKGDPGVVIATIHSTGFENRAVKAELRDGKKVLDQSQLILTSGENQRVKLRFHADEAGRRVLTVAVAQQSEERVSANNSRQISVEVDQQQWKVLQLAGYPNWDFRFLDHALRRDRGIDRTLIMEAGLPRAGRTAEADSEEGQKQGKGKAKNENPQGSNPSKADSEVAKTKSNDLPQLANLPETREAFAAYDLVMIGDVSPRLLPPRSQQQLAKAVRQEGVGLLVQAGPEHVPADYGGEPLADLLPVKLGGRKNAENAGNAENAENAGNSERVEAERGGRDGAGLRARPFDPFRMKILASGSIHPALRLRDSASANRQLWSRMPPFFWAADLGQAKPGATVLAELKTANASHPLIAEHWAGRGRVMIVGLDSTYRWRRNVGDTLFYRFWGQAIRHLASEKDSDPNQSWLDAHPARVNPGGDVGIELYAVDSQGNPIEAEEASLQVRRGEKRRSLSLKHAGRPGFFRGSWHGDQPGNYEMRYTPPANNQNQANQPLTTHVRVAASGNELANPSVDRQTLGTISQITGGALLEPSRIDSLPQRITGEPTTEDRIFEQSIWDNWMTLMLLVGLYCTDVFVRRMSGVT